MRQRFSKIEYDNTFSDLNLKYISKIEAADCYSFRGLHCHQNICEITIILAGSNKYFIHNNYENVNKNDLLVINPGIIHSEGNILPSICIGVASKRKEATWQLIPEYRYPIFHFSAEIVRSLTQLANMAFQLLKSDNYQANLLANNSICNAFIPFLQKSAITSKTIKHTNTTGGQLIKNYLDKHFFEPIKINDMCSDLGLSKTYAEQQLVENYGYTPIQYLTMRRIGEAQTLLITKPYLKIYEIALAVGYDNVTYFNRVFKKFSGLAPKQYRRLYLEKVQL